MLFQVPVVVQCLGVVLPCTVLERVGLGFLHPLCLELWLCEYRLKGVFMKKKTKLCNCVLKVHFLEEECLQGYFVPPIDATLRHGVVANQ